MIFESGYRFIIKKHHGEFFEREYILLDRKKKFSIQAVQPDYFLKMYKGYGCNIYPYNTENYQEAHELCIDKPMLYNGRLYRCSKLALLKSQLELTGQLYDEEEIKPWKPYLDYEGIGYTSDIEEIRVSLEKFHIAEKVCKSCPDKLDNCKIANEQNSLPLSLMVRSGK